MVQMRLPSSTHLFLLILSTSFSNCFSLQTWPPVVGFGNGAIDLGGLLICQIKNFTKVWTTHEGGPDNIGATFYEPSELPDGFYMLGSYSHSNTRPLSSWVLAGKDATNDLSSGTLKSPIDYTLVLNSTFLMVNQSNIAYVWQPIPPEGYVVVGNVITGSPEKPPLDKIRCVRSDFVVLQENSHWVWGSKDESSSNSFNIYSSMRDEGNNKAIHVPTGTFFVQSNASVPHLKNVPGNFSAMPNMTQINELMRKYAPVIYFHPDEEFFPSSVSWFFEHGGLLYTKGQESNPILIDPTGSNLPQGGSDDGLYWLDLPTNDEDRAMVKKGNVLSAHSYLHIKPTIGATNTDIAIFIFYPFNGPAKAKVLCFDIKFNKFGEHVGDWEHITLRVSNFDGQLKSIYFSQHSKGVWIDASEIEYIYNNKPLVYSSLHGHAAYPNEGENLIGNDQFGLRNDAAKGQFFMDTGINYTIISADYLNPPIVEPFWLNFARKWGPKITYDIADEINKAPKIVRHMCRDFFEKLPKEILGEDGPIGPKWKDSWNGDERT